MLLLGTKQCLNSLLNTHKPKLKIEGILVYLLRDCTLAVGCLVLFRTKIIFVLCFLISNISLTVL